ncbi:MAG: pantothenate metabolism flavoprotein [Ferruginibacter sp.]|nr:pantothenate metabolism flavoprotein [Rhodoferax sp.]
MASITIRNLDEQLKTQLRMRAASHGCSMEQEARDILRRAVQTPESSTGLAFAQKIHQRFAGVHVDTLPVPARSPARVTTLTSD